ncbi:hypothetical protein [Deinococcus metallilatus]|uniref:Uncharacterized protein n=1 Tax=Deinococcus metallilatus TaxID=1211322 RepID=A0ABR6MWT3_9DEIO|nr:hypothetical protein [Deinococcus metallilatus]MBB5296393.1 hypothetical protein [Deinococcus metallilatus]GMA14694.1 hypothetical protein GCM10025871_10250 [Deinococcus metallilatus]
MKKLTLALALTLLFGYAVSKGALATFTKVLTASSGAAAPTPSRRGQGGR